VCSFQLKTSQPVIELTNQRFNHPFNQYAT
jgi:hypothetical protein